MNCLEVHQISQFGTKWSCLSVHSRTSWAKLAESSTLSMAWSTRSQRSVNGESRWRRRRDRFFLPAFDKTQDFADGDGFRRARQQVAAFGAAARFDKAALLQAGQNQFQKLLRNLLPAGDLGDLHRLAAGIGRRGRKWRAGRTRP